MGTVTRSGFPTAALLGIPDLCVGHFRDFQRIQYQTQERGRSLSREERTKERPRVGLGMLPKWGNLGCSWLRVYNPAELALS